MPSELGCLGDQKYKFHRPVRAATRLLGREVEQLTVEAKKLGLRLEEVQASVAEHWSQLDYKEAKEEA